MREVESPVAPALFSYEQARPLIRSGDLLLCSGRSPMSRLIQRATRSCWSHVAFILRLDVIDRIMVLESVESIGVRCVPLSAYAWDYNGSGRRYDGELVIARHDCFDHGDARVLRSAARSAVDRLGAPYDANEIARIAARIAWSAVDRLNGEPADSLRRDRAYICSEFVWECLFAANIAVAHDRRGFIAPADFAGDPNVRLLYQLE